MFVTKKRFNEVLLDYDDLYEDYFKERAKVETLLRLVQSVYDSGQLKSRPLMKEIEGVLENDES